MHVIVAPSRQCTVTFVLTVQKLKVISIEAPELRINKH